MNDEIWYREELVALRALVEQAIGRTHPANVPEMVALGRLHEKLDQGIERAPSARTPTDAA